MISKVIYFCDINKHRVAIQFDKPLLTAAVLQTDITHIYLWQSSILYTYCILQLNKWLKSTSLKYPV